MGSKEDTGVVRVDLIYICGGQTQGLIAMRVVERRSWFGLASGRRKMRRECEFYV